MAKTLLAMVFLTLTVMWGLILFIYYGGTMTIDMYLTLDVLPIGLSLLAYAAVRHALTGVVDKGEVPIATKTKQSAIELYEVERAKAEQKQALSNEITSRIKSNETKSKMETALEVLKSRKKDIGTE